MISLHRRQQVIAPFDNIHEHSTSDQCMSEEIVVEAWIELWKCQSCYHNCLMMTHCDLLIESMPVMESVTHRMTHEINFDVQQDLQCENGNRELVDVHCELLRDEREVLGEGLMLEQPVHQQKVEFVVSEGVFFCVVEEKSFLRKKTRVELGEDHSLLKRKANVAFFFFITLRNLH